MNTLPILLLRDDSVTLGINWTVVCSVILAMIIWNLIVWVFNKTQRPKA